ncbi:MAG: discoidin domain-containing protein [Candidatus Omnitrophota bacterium]|nr:discoidin domain-containing protein [Candidatus Omnitrophota bacterium]
MKKNISHILVGTGLKPVPTVRFLLCLFILCFFTMGMGSRPKPPPVPAVTSWWLSMDLGKTGNLSKIAIFWNSTYGSTDYVIQGSTNNSTWVNLQTGQSSAGATTKEHALSGSYRYVRIYINKAQNTYPIICEVKIYGTLPEPEPPRIISFIPQDGAGFNEVEVVSISATVANDASAVEYQFSIDGAVKQIWSKNPIYKWTAQPGRHAIKVEVRNSKGNDSKQTEVYVYRKPIAPL